MRAFFDFIRMLINLEDAAFGDCTETEILVSSGRALTEEAGTWRDQLRARGVSEKFLTSIDALPFQSSLWRGQLLDGFRLLSPADVAEITSILTVNSPVELVRTAVSNFGNLRH